MKKRNTGDAFVTGMFKDETSRRALEAYRVTFMARPFQDSIGFAGVKMACRILGLAHLRTWNR